MGPFRARTQEQWNAQAAGERNNLVHDHYTHHTHCSRTTHRDISLASTFLQLFLDVCEVVTRKNLYTHYSQVTSMPKNERSAEGGREGAGRNTVRRGGAAGVRPSKVGKLMGSNGETDKCTAGKTNNPIKKENPLALPRRPPAAGSRIPNSPGTD